MSASAIEQEVLVIGAGPAGLAAAAALRMAGASPVILDRSAQVGSSWRSRYDRLRLNTSTWFCYLPGLRFPRHVGRFPRRDDVADYLESYAAHHRLDVRLEVDVQRIDREDEAWRLSTLSGPLYARSVVLATGWDHVAYVPDWPGRDRFEPPLIHAAEYRNPEAYHGRDVLVVGPGCTGAEIAYDLASGGATRVRLAVRRAPHLTLRQTWGLPGDALAVAAGATRQPIRLSDAQASMMRRLTIGDLTPLGLPEPRDGLFSHAARTNVAPTVIDREVVRAIKRREIEIVRAVVALEKRLVQLDDGSSLEPDAVIAATGYRRGLEPLVGHLGVLGSDGAPLATGGRAHPAAPGLYFVGFEPRVSGTLRQIRLEAKRVARAQRHTRRLPQPRRGEPTRPPKKV